MVQNLATTGRQLTEGFNTAVKALGDNVTQGVNQLLQVPATGLRGLRLPGLGQGAGALNLADPLGLFRGGSSHNNNPNGFLGNGGNPLAAVTNVVKAFGQVEDVILPRGLPRPSALILGVTTPTEPVATDMNGVVLPTTRGAGTSIGIEGGQRPAAERRVGRQAGVQAV